jgi:hypothetical protein
LPNHLEDRGYILTLSRFFALLIRISIIGYSNMNKESQGEDVTQAEKFVCLLERMEMSNGFLNLEKKTYKPHY